MFEIFILPPRNNVILLSDGSKRMPTKLRCGCQVCIKLDFSAEALVAFGTSGLSYHRKNLENLSFHEGVLIFYCK